MNSELENSYGQLVANLAKSGESIVAALSAHQAHVIHMAIGVSGEAGELLDCAKKYAIYNKPIDLNNLIEEMGDIEFFLEGLRQAFSLSREQILAGNITKLTKRYSSGTYSDKQAQERADKK